MNKDNFTQMDFNNFTRDVKYNNKFNNFLISFHLIIN